MTNTTETTTNNNNNNTTIAQRIKAAVAATKSLVSGYLEKTLETRTPGPNRCGSVIDACDGHPISRGLEHLLFGDMLRSWEAYPDCPSLAPGCVAFRCNRLGGTLGVVPLADLPPETMVRLDDRKGTGQVSATVKGVPAVRVPFTVLILGPEQGREVVYTVHPGDPVPPSIVPAEGMDGRTVRAASAAAMGLQYAKLVA